MEIELKNYKERAENALSMVTPSSNMKRFIYFMTRLESWPVEYLMIKGNLQNKLSYNNENPMSLYNDDTWEMLVKGLNYDGWTQFGHELNDFGDDGFQFVGYIFEDSEDTSIIMNKYFEELDNIADNPVKISALKAEALKALELVNALSVIMTCTI